MDYSHIVEQIARCHEYAQAQAASAVNVALTIRNWLAGAHIIEYEQHGEDRAKYGARLLPTLAKDLKQKGYKGLSLSNLKSYRQFALAYPSLEKGQAVPGFLAATKIPPLNLLGPLLGNARDATDSAFFCEPVSIARDAHKRCTSLAERGLLRQSVARTFLDALRRATSHRQSAQARVLRDRVAEESLGIA